MNYTISVTPDHHACVALRHALEFCESLDVTSFGPIYLDAGFDHRDRVRELL